MISMCLLYLFCACVFLQFNFVNLKFTALPATKLINLTDNLENSISRVSKELSDLSQQNVVKSSQLSVACKEDIDYLFNINQSVFDMPTSWKMQMIDSNGKWSAGIMEGNVFWMGDFTQCIKTKVWKSADQSQSPDFSGKYCIHSLNHYLPPLPKQFNLVLMTSGICLPSSCSHTDAENLINQYIFPLQTRVTEEMCDVDDIPEIDWVTTASFVVIGALIVAAVSGTFYDVVHRVANKLKVRKIKRLSKSKAHRFLLAFSVYTNTIKLLDTSSVKEQNLSCINGLRAFSMHFVVSGHFLTAVLYSSNGRHNPQNFWTVIRTWWHQPYIYAQVMVDTFFCITGFLLTYGSMKFKMETGRFSFIDLYIARMLRITPTFLFVTLLVMGPYQVISKGPLWKTDSVIDRENCRKNFWKTPFYINVFASLDEEPLCLYHTWYLNADMFYIFTCPIILYPILKKHWTGPVMWTILLISAVVAESIACYLKHPENIFIPGMNFNNFMTFCLKINVKPWLRSQSFLIGMAFGYVYFKFGNKLKLTKEQVFIGWSIAVATMILYIYGNYFYGLDTVKMKPSQFAQIVFISVAPMAWAVAIGWIILACSTGYGGVINSILSSKIFVPVARLSFSTYVSHLLPLMYFGKSRKEVLYLDDCFVIYSDLGLLFISLIVGWITTSLIERPFLELEHIYRKNIKMLTENRTVKIIG